MFELIMLWVVFNGEPMAAKSYQPKETPVTEVMAFKHYHEAVRLCESDARQLRRVGVSAWCQLQTGV